MKLTNSLIKLPQISAVMRDMSMEMTKVRHIHTVFPIHVELISGYADIGWYHGGDARRYS